ncbi:MAG: hypothetical protein J0M02_02245 [Planctomycetes bacterium]|nr:hypothetical protein [Planctomycetota bacterium]
MHLTLMFRLLAAFTLIAAICAAVAWVGVSGLRHTSTSMERMTHIDVALLVLIQEAHIGLLTERRFEKDLFLNCGDDKSQRQYLERFEKSAKRRTSAYCGSSRPPPTIQRS